MFDLLYGDGINDLSYLTKLPFFTDIIGEFNWCEVYVSYMLKKVTKRGLSFSRNVDNIIVKIYGNLSEMLSYMDGVDKCISDIVIEYALLCSKEIFESDDFYAS
jgi:hypothetical protein